jgi:glycosyltransferase involved in cell wall biosynthesis
MEQEDLKQNNKQDHKQDQKPEQHTERRSEDWSEHRDPNDWLPLRVVERTLADRKWLAKRLVASSPSSDEVPSVSLIIPTRNEARNIAAVLDHVPDFVSEVVLVDTLSSDVTKLMARTTMPDIRIVDEPAHGKGNALRAGLAAGTGDVLVAMDADGSMSPEEIPRFCYPLRHGFDFTKGSRFMAGGGSLDITPIRHLGNWALTKLVNRLFKVRYTDLCYGFFAVRRIFLESLDLQSSGFEIETEITLQAQIKGLRIAEVPSVELPRRDGSSGLRAWRDGLRILRTILFEYHTSDRRTRNVAMKA